MTPIVNPLWFYLFDIVEKLSTTSIAIAVLLAIGGLVYYLIWGICEGNKIKYSKFIMTVFIISTILAIFVPSKKLVIRWRQPVL